VSKRKQSGRAAIKAITAGVALLASPHIIADGSSAIGTWKTPRVESGGYLHVAIEACDNRLCGKIVKAFNKDDAEGVDYEHLGKNMVTGMLEKQPGKYAKGKIWAPDTGKTYNSKMKIKDGQLIVSGCVMFICRSQVWSRVY